MENASKALIMAGEILIALLIIALLVFGFTKISNLSETEQGTIEAEQLAAFNKQYESYNRKLLRGVDVISLINKAIDNNKKYDNEELYKITIKFELREKLVAYEKEKYTDDKGLTAYRYVAKSRDSLDAGYHTISKDSDTPYVTLMDRTKTDEETFNNFKRRIFDCIDVKYNKLGRVCEMTFKERKESDSIVF